MRLKEIKPGMVIHCKTHEEKMALLQDAEGLGYKWSNHLVPTNCHIIENSGMTIHFHAPSRLWNFNHITWSDNTEGVTEFSDLIMPELTAEEVLQICGELCKEYSNKGNACSSKCPFAYHGMSCTVYRAENYDKVIEACEKYKSEHEKKEPEVEWVYRVFGAENFGEKFFNTEEEAIARCEELVKSQKNRQYARYEKVCRVKE